MTHDSLLNDDWNRTIERLGGAEALATGARDTQAFAWGRKIPTPMVLLRLVLAYCLGEWGATLDHGLGHRHRFGRYLQRRSSLSAAAVSR
jgi:hypothetical protein